MHFVTAVKVNHPNACTHNALQPQCERCVEKHVSKISTTSTLCGSSMTSGPTRASHKKKEFYFFLNQEKKTISTFGVSVD
jgi:hypothetical protein